MPHPLLAPQVTCTAMRGLWADASPAGMWGPAAGRPLRTRRVLYPGVQGAPAGPEVTLCVLCVHGMGSLR